MTRLPQKVRRLLDKSVDAALLAVEIYNKPRTSFRSNGYTLLMHVAWTSLFHSIFEKRNVKYFYKKDKIHYEKTDGEWKAWELGECIKNFYTNLNTDIVKNLEFFIKLRNKIEHRFAPEVDQDIFGECQALLINYENLIEEEFGAEFTINDNLVFSLQFSKILHSEQIKASKIRQSKDYKTIKQFVDEYRGSLDKNIIESLNYNFRVYLLPKVGNHRTSSDFTLEFVKYNLDDPKEADRYKKFLVAIKEKQIPMEGLRAGEASKQVYEGLKIKMPSNWKFTSSSHHAKCWKYYKVRPNNGSSTPDATNLKYCFYDKTFKQYGYTEEWIKFLVNKLSDKKEYIKVMRSK